MKTELCAICGIGEAIERMNSDDSRNFSRYFYCLRCGGEYLTDEQILDSKRLPNNEELRRQLQGVRETWQRERAGYDASCSHLAAKAAENLRRAERAEQRLTNLSVTVRELAPGGPWRLFIDEYGCADWPSGEFARENPKAYAEEVIEKNGNAHELTIKGYATTFPAIYGRSHLIVESGIDRYHAWLMRAKETGFLELGWVTEKYNDDEEYEYHHSVNVDNVQSIDVWIQDDDLVIDDPREGGP